MRSYTILIGKFMPLLVLAIFGYTFYVFIFRICVDSLLGKMKVVQAVIYLVTFNILFIMALSSYIRVINKNPGTPKLPQSLTKTQSRQQQEVINSSSTSTSSHPQSLIQQQHHQLQSSIYKPNPTLKSFIQEQEQEPQQQQILNKKKSSTNNNNLAPTSSPLPTSYNYNFNPITNPNNSSNADAFLLPMENALLKPKSKRSTSSHLSQNLMPPNTVNTKAPITTATTTISITPSITSKDNNNNPDIINSINLSLPIHTNNIYVRKRDGRLRRCDRCNDVKPDRCHHCSECDKCILRMDHHCPWINGCVGFHNYKFFYLFIVYTSLFADFVFAATIPVVVNDYQTVGGIVDTQWIVLTIISFVFGILLTGFTAVHTKLLINNKTTIENLSFKSRIYHLKISLNIDNSVADGINSSTSNFSNNSTNERIFVSSRRGENIWDLGHSRNWKSVMGDKWWQWFLPINNKSGGDGLSYPLNPIIHQRLIDESKKQNTNNSDRISDSNSNNSRNKLEDDKAIINIINANQDQQRTFSNNINSDYLVGVGNNNNNNIGGSSSNSNSNDINNINNSYISVNDNNKI